MKKQILFFLFLGLFLNGNAQKDFSENVTQAIYGLFLPIELLQSERPAKEEIKQAIEQKTAIRIMQEAFNELKNEAAANGLQDLKKRYNNKNTKYLHWENSSMISESKIVFEKEGTKTILDLRLELELSQMADKMEIAIYPSYQFIDETGKEQIRMDVAMPGVPAD